MLRKSSKCTKEDMFAKTYGEKVVHDSSRTLVNCAGHLILWLLISSCVTLALARHGVPMVVNSTQRRVARVVTYIESVGESVAESAEESASGRGEKGKSKKGKNEKASKSSNQVWHEDFSNFLAGYFQHDFGLSVFVSCLGESKVDIVRRSYGGPFTKGMKRRRLKVELQKGEALVMGSGLRHRGSSFTKRNVPLFLAFLVGKSEGASFETTHNVQGERKMRGGKRVVQKAGFWKGERARRC
ncbi:unnamed protein product [Ectocarpus sp. 13 AM-2016]